VIIGCGGRIKHPHYDTSDIPPLSHRLSRFSVMAVTANQATAMAEIEFSLFSRHSAIGSWMLLYGEVMVNLGAHSGLHRKRT